jgi:hypothetical protein
VAPALGGRDVALGVLDRFLGGGDFFVQQLDVFLGL